MFLGRLCRSEVDLLHKDIFTNSVAEYLLGFSNICHITKSLLYTISKYNLNEFLQNYISSGYFPPKNIWNKYSKAFLLQNENNTI